MRILLGHRPVGYLDYDETRYDLRYAPKGPDGLNPPRTIDEMLKTCPVGWIPDVYYHPSIGHVPIPKDIENFPGLSVTDVEDSDRMGVAVWAGVGFFDLAITDLATWEILKKSGYEHVHRGRLYHYSHEFDRIVPGVEKDIDVLFIGMLNDDVWDERNRWLNRLAKIPFKVAITNGHFGEAYTHLMNRAKIVFNFGVRGESNGRTYQAPMCGAMLLAEDTNHETHEIFNDHEHCVYYNEQNFEELIQYYLTHEDERARIIEAARAVIIKEHSCRHHTDKIFEIFEQNLNVRYRPSLSLPEAERRRRFSLQMYYTGNCPPAYIIEELAESEQAGGEKALLILGSAAVHACAAKVQIEKKREDLLNYAHAAAKEIWQLNSHITLNLVAVGAISKELADIKQIPAVSAALELQLAVDILTNRLKSYSKDYSDIDGFIYPHSFDRFDVLLSRATLRRNIDEIAWANQVRKILIWYCSMEVSKIAVDEEKLIKAIEYARIAVESLPEEGSSHLLLGRILTLQASFSEAIARYSEGLKILPLSYEAWLEYAATLAMAGRWKEADAFIEERLQVISAIPPIEDIRQPLLAAIGRG